MTHTSVLLSVLVLFGAGCAASIAPADAGSSEKPRKQSARPNSAQTKPANAMTIVAHRGLHHTLPENSKESMVAAWKAGVEWCECDVYLSADGVAVLMHDAKLERTTQAKGPVAERKWSELRALRLKNPDGTLSKCRVPSLQEVLAAMPAGCGLLIEVKPADDEKLVREVLRLAKKRRVVIQSFDMPNVRHALRLAKDMPTACLVGKPERLDEALAGDWPALNIEFKMLNEDVMRRARAAGKSLGVWTVNEPEDIGRVLDAGITLIITDQPERVRALSQATATRPHDARAAR